MMSFARQVLAFLIVSTLAFGFVELGGEHKSARAATVAISVTCLNTLPEVPITAAQGDTVEVTIDSGCYGGANPTAAAVTPQAWRLSHFSSWPNPAAVPNTVTTFTWVVSASAPIGPMTGAKTALPYVCSNCLIGAYLRFTITAAATTTLAPTTSSPATTTVPVATTPVPTTPVVTTTLPELVAGAVTLPETGVSLSLSLWAAVLMSAGVLILGSARFWMRTKRI
jgi:hypothetical protein